MSELGIVVLLIVNITDFTNHDVTNSEHCAVWGKADMSLVKFQYTVKMLGNKKDPSEKGLYGSIVKFLDGLEKTIKRFPEKKVLNVCDKLRELYDKKMSDPTTGQQTEIHIWIPVWRTTCEKAMIVSIIGRINLIIT